MVFDQRGENILDAVSSMQHSANKLALYRKYRPKVFADIVGQPHVVEILRAEVSHNATAHAYIFIGPRGTGKTSTARILAKALNCRNIGVNGDPCNRCDACRAINEGSFIDLIEIDAASNRGIDNIREIKERVAFPPSQGRKKVYIIDEVHMLTKEAFNALLKTLEEPPEHVVFILATTEPHKVPETIMSRCERLDFHLADNQTLLAHLQNIASLEGITIDNKAAVILVEQARGSFRDLLTLLDSVYAVSKNITEDVVRRTLRLPDEKFIRTVLYTVFSKDFDGVINVLQHIEHQGVNMTTLLSDLIRFTRDRLLLEPSFTSYRGHFIQFIAMLFKAFDNIQFVFDPGLLVESTLHRYMLSLKEPLLRVVNLLESWGIAQELVNEISHKNFGFNRSNGGLQKIGNEDGNDNSGISESPIELVNSNAEGNHKDGDNDDTNSKDLSPDKGGDDGENNITPSTEDEHADKINVALIPMEKLFSTFKKIIRESAPSYLYSYLLHARVREIKSVGEKTLVLVIRAPDYTFYKQRTQHASVQNILNSALSKALKSIGFGGIVGEVKIEYDRRLNSNKPNIRRSAKKSQSVDMLDSTEQGEVSKSDRGMGDSRRGTSTSSGFRDISNDWLTVFGGELERLS